MTTLRFSQSLMQCLIASVTVACLLLPCFITSSVAQAPASQMVTQDTVGKTYTILVPNYASINPDKITQMTNGIENQQEAIKADLFSQLAQDKLSDEAKAQVIQLIGDFRVYQAVYLLIQNIDFRHFRPSANGTPITTATVLDDGYVARQSLLQLGNITDYAILEVIGSRNKGIPFNSANVNGYCWVLNALQGSILSTQQLKQQLAAEKDAKVQAQYRSVLNRMESYPPD